MPTNHKSRPIDGTIEAAAPLLRWLERFAAAVRAIDYQTASKMFSKDVVSFGTFARMVHSRDELIQNQWQMIWPHTRNFHFLIEEAHIERQNDLAWITSPWLSEGRDDRGNWYDRPGRCTLILKRTFDEWRCVHSHYSQEPKPPQKSNTTKT